MHATFPQQQMLMVVRTVKLLNQAKAEATDSERCAIKTEAGTDTANKEGANSSSLKKNDRGGFQKICAIKG